MMTSVNNNYCKSVLVIGRWDSYWGLNLLKIQAKNSSICENTMTGIWGSHMHMLLVMGSQNSTLFAMNIEQLLNLLFQLGNLLLY